jgi:hypothetical protein
MKSWVWMEVWSLLSAYVKSLRLTGYFWIGLVMALD